MKKCLNSSDHVVQVTARQQVYLAHLLHQMWWFPMT